MPPVISFVVKGYNLSKYRLNILDGNNMRNVNKLSKKKTRIMFSYLSIAKDSTLTPKCVSHTAKKGANANPKKNPDRIKPKDAALHCFGITSDNADFKIRIVLIVEAV